MNVCQFADCDQPAIERRPLCEAHMAAFERLLDKSEDEVKPQPRLKRRYTRKATGNPPGRPRKNDGPCSFDGCKNQAHARGWCKSHYSQWRRTGTLKPLGRTPKPCAFESCDRLARSRGLCVAHRSQQKRGIELRPLRPKRRIDDDHKQCSNCLVIKTMDAFTRPKDRYCKPCDKAYKAAYYQARKAAAQ